MFHGSLVAVVTPMHADGSVDFQAFSKLLDMHIACNTDGVVVLGTTGESATVTAKEYDDILSHAVAQIAGRIPVIAGSGLTCTQKAIELTQRAMSHGVDGCLLMSPAYVKPTQEGLYQHFKAIADAVAIPQILYNVPGRTASDILPETVSRLANISNIVGIKEASGSLQRTQELIERCSDKLDVLSGEDDLAMDVMLQGGKGVISVTANVAPKLMYEMCSAALRGDQHVARSINSRLEPLHDKLFCESNPIPVKWALHKMGMIAEGIRLPLTVLDTKYHSELYSALQQAEVIA